METKKPRKQAKAPATNTSALTDAIPFDDAVSDGKKILAHIEDVTNGSQWQLGELADKVEPKYGDRTQAKFAKALGIAPCTLKRYLSVYRRWAPIIGAPGPQSVSYSVLRELATLPDEDEQIKIIRARPDLTKREAQEIVRKHKGTAKEEQEQAQEDEWLKHNRKWFKDLLALANDVSRMAGVVDECTPEQLENLLQAVDPTALMYLRGGGRRLFLLANHLAELLGWEAEVEEFTVLKASVPIDRVHPEASAQVAA